MTFHFPSKIVPSLFKFSLFFFHSHLLNPNNNNKVEDESTLLLTLKEEDKDDCNSWYLDNGASNHMCGHKDKFVEIKKVVKDNVSFGDISKIQIEGIGTILISYKDCGHKLIINI